MSTDRTRIAHSSGDSTLTCGNALKLTGRYTADRTLCARRGGRVIKPPPDKFECHSIHDSID